MNSYKRQIILEELEKAKHELLQPKIQLAKQNIAEAKRNIHKKRLTEFFIDASRSNPGATKGIPYSPWDGGVNEKNEKTLKNICWPTAAHKKYRDAPDLMRKTLDTDPDTFKRLAKHGGWWHPESETKEVVWEMDVIVQEVTVNYNVEGEKGKTVVSDPENKGADRLWFYADGTVWSTTTVTRRGYEASVHADHPNGTITLYKHKNGPSSKKDVQHFWEDDTVAGKIFFDKTKNRPVLQLAKAEEKYAKRGEHKTLDRINTIFDWIGFIPGIGDIVDVINGFIYYYRCTVLKEDKWLDVILSAIAAIPFLGSAVAISARAILKTSSQTRKIRSLTKSIFKGTDNAEEYSVELWKLLQKGEVLTPKQMQAIAKSQYISKLSNMLRRSKKPIGDVIGTAHVKQFDAFADKLDELGKGIDKISDIGKGMDKPTGDLGSNFFRQISKDAPAKNLSYIGKMGDKINTGIFKRLTRIKGYPDKEVKRMAKMMEQGFQKTMKASPDKLAMLSRSLGTDPSVYRSMAKEMTEIQEMFAKNPELKRKMKANLADMLQQSSKLDPSSVRQVREIDTNVISKDMMNFSNPGRTTTVVDPIEKIPYGKNLSGKTISVKRGGLSDKDAAKLANDMLRPDYLKKLASKKTPLTTEQFHALFKTMDKTGKDFPGVKQIYSNLGDVVSGKAVTDNNFMWNMYKMNGTANIRTLVRAGDDATASMKGFFKSMNLRFSKWVDIIYNEYEEIREQMGWESRDEAQGVVVTLMRMAIYDNLSINSKEDIKDLLGKADAVGDFLGTTTAQGMNTVTNMVPGGLTPTVSDFTEYDPGEDYGSGGDYDEFGTGV